MMGRNKHNLINMEKNVSELAGSKQYQSRRKKKARADDTVDTFFKSIKKADKKKSIFFIEDEFKKQKPVSESARFFDFNHPVSALGLENLERSDGASRDIPQSWTESIEKSEFQFEVETFDALGEHEIPRPARFESSSIPLEPERISPEKMKETPSQAADIPDTELQAIPEISGMSPHDILYAQGLQDIVSKKTDFRPALNPQIEPEEETKPRAGLAGSHAIFDEIAQGLQTAETFDLGDVAVDFEALDMAMEEEEARAAAKLKGRASAKQLSEMDIIEDFALMRTQIDAKPSVHKSEGSIPIKIEQDRIDKGRLSNDELEQKDKNALVKNDTERPLDKKDIDEILKKLKGNTTSAELVKKAISEMIEREKLPAKEKEATKDIDEKAKADVEGETNKIENSQKESTNIKEIKQ
jgi:hypothetical protein